MIKEAKYIKEISFSSLVNWSVQYLSETKISFNSSYSMMKIGSFLNRNKTAIDIEDDRIYKRATIKVRNGGVFLRDEEIGAKIGTKKQFVISEGQFLLSKIDARNGAFGVVPSELEKGIITGNFWTYDVDYNIVNPHYLSLVVTTSEFIEFCEQASNGTTNRHYLQEPLFLDIKIPLPTIDEQNKLVAEYNKLMNLATKQEEQATAKENEIEEYILDKLGISINKKNSSTLLNFISFKDTSRWDVQFFFSGTKLKSKYEVVNISDCISRFMKDEQGKSLRRDTGKTPQDDFYYIGMEHIEKESGEVLDMPNVKGADIKSQTVYIPNGYFIYGKLRPYLNKYWVNTTDLSNIVCSSEFFVFSVKESFNQLFFKYILASDIVQQQIVELFSGARMPRINEEVFMNIKLPTPPIKIQNEIASHISELKEEIKTLRTNAENNRKKALINFEERIF